MNYNEAFEKLSAIGQEHILKFYDELSAQQKEELLLQIEETDFSILSAFENRQESEETENVIEPLDSLTLDEIEKNRDRYFEIGSRAIRDGKVAAVLLAGGMGTRLGSSDPKCMYDIGVTHPVYIVERLLCNLMEVTDRVGALVPFYIMTSEKNHESTVNFMKEHNCFGYDPSMIHYFKQDMAPAIDYSGKVYMESRGRIATSPNGNGGWFRSMVRSGLADEAEKNGVEYLNIFAVDNVLQRIADPCFIGAAIDSGCACASKSVRKAYRDEKVGVFCRQNGKPSVIEYFDMTPELLDAVDEKGEPLYNFGAIMNYLFREKDLRRIVDDALPIHLVEKKIEHIDSEGNRVEAAEPNGYKFEQLAIDMVHELDTCLPFEVIREREFAPIKNPTGKDSVESARELCRKNGIEL